MLTPAAHRGPVLLTGGRGVLGLIPMEPIGSSMPDPALQEVHECPQPSTSLVERAEKALAEIGPEGDVAHVSGSRGARHRGAQCMGRNEQGDVQHGSWKCSGF
ncbi:hypothetical protein CSOJ01_06238 [Colletotrichum sojae]|uniref:Uncharacterized protein n=1 Tax=Colletotrichum sojae TaxID=2175907 RepID=A0A8H6MVF4_9PEZI|nr:hypothetical protein CSOJ01_06238 [Colletotrichum sojae]